MPWREEFSMRIRCALTCPSGQLTLLVNALLASKANALRWCVLPGLLHRPIESKDLLARPRELQAFDSMMNCVAREC